MKPKPITIMGPLIPDRIKGRDIPGFETEEPEPPKQPEPESEDACSLDD